MDESKADPDYESYNSSVKLHEEEDRNKNAAKFRQILEEEYNKDLVARQQQIIQIEMQICKFRKLLSLLRYVLVSSYYKRNDLEYKDGEDVNITSSTSVHLPDQQSRIHPAVKKLLGRNVQNLNHLNLNDKRKSQARMFVESPPNKKARIEISSTDSASAASQDVPPETKLVTCNDIVEVSDEKPEVRTNEETRNRKKTKHRLVVGNISKWMPSSENDVLTHKWMMYVRGPKEEPDVSHIIDKVVFYLHPSYKPHDVVEICESPYHLCRRGWGEFPVRVKIYFKASVNKPIDVIHNIKLDLKYTGRQTLGNETVLDVFLYDTAKGKPIESQQSETPFEQSIDLEEESESSEQVHPVQSRVLLEDHMYCKLYDEQDQPSVKIEKIEQDESNQLIYGLDKYYTEPNETKKSVKINSTNEIGTPLIPINTLKQFIQQSRKDGKLNNARIIVVTNINKLSPVIVGQNHRLVLPEKKFKNMGEALPYVFRKLPLFSELAKNFNYKKLYPFTAPNLKEYLSWNIGKRRSSEWSRAKTVLKILTAAKVHGVEKWNTKAVFMYARSHDFTPDPTYGLFVRKSDEKSLLMSCFQDTLRKQSELPNYSNDITVDVDSDLDVANFPKKSKPTFADISDPNLRLECSFVRQTARDSGIILKSEEIEEGISFNGAERMILQALKCLVDNLIRRGNNNRLCTNYSPSATVNKEDIEAAIRERSELVSLCRFQNKRKNMAYFS